MSGLFGKLLDLLYPPKCAFCRRPVPGSRMLCPDCEGKLPRPSAADAVRYDIEHLALCRFPLYYTGTVRESLHRYKFRGAAAYCRIYAELMAGCLSGEQAGFDRVTWVPLSRNRLRTRGYDQAKLLAEETARLLGLPCERLLEKTRNNRAQSGTGSVQERYENVKGVYRCVKAPAGERILLVDDIVTTGATLSAAAAELTAAGAASVTGLTVAGSARNRDKTTEENGDSGNADF
ncbi:MAG: ComF family protein [Oscillospiraceae bacterium]|nr:ComF family protein [Oscillospiraceae bacterium]